MHRLHDSRVGTSRVAIPPLVASRWLRVQHTPARLQMPHGTPPLKYRRQQPLLYTVFYPAEGIGARGISPTFVVRSERVSEWRAFP